MKRFRIFLFCVLVAVFQACAEESAYGPDIIPDDEFINGELVDTLTIEARIELDDTLRADNTRYSLVGNMWDPETGKTKCSFYTTVSITQPVQSFGVNPQIDSIVMILQFHKGYGDVSKLTGYQELQVFEVLDTIPQPPSGEYNQHNIQFSVSSQPVGKRGFVPQFGTGADYSRLRIRLDPSLGQRLLDADSLKNSNLRSLIKGFYVTAEIPFLSPGTGGIASFDLSATGSSIAIYFKNASAPIQTVSLSMAGNQNIRINRFEHDFTAGEPMLAQKLANPDFDYSLQPDLYVKSMQGIRIFFKVPHLLKLNDTARWVVNRAEIIIPVKAFDFEKYSLPSMLMTYYYTEGHLIRPMDDITANYFSGEYNSDKKAFILRPTRYFQKVLGGSVPNDGFYIDLPVLTNQKVSEASRAVLAGPKDPVSPMKINLILTRITN